MSTSPETGFVLVALDGSLEDQAAVAWGAVEAVHRRTALRLVHVVAPPVISPPFGADASAVMSRYASSTREVFDAARAAVVTDHADEVTVEERVRLGEVVPTLLAEAQDAGLVVLGSGRRVDAGHARLGSVAVHLTAHAPCPVVVTRTPLEGEARTGPSAGRIVVGVDGSAVSTEAVGFAFEEASWRGLGLTAVHAWQDPAPGRIEGDQSADRYEREAGQVLAGSLAPWREKFPDVAVVERVPCDHPVRALVEESAGAVLLVLGCHGRGGFAGMLLGSVSQALLRHAATSVAIVRPREG